MPVTLMTQPYRTIPTPNSPAWQSIGPLNLPPFRTVSSSITLPFQVQVARKTAPSFNRFRPVRPPREMVRHQVAQPPLRPAAMLLLAQPKLFFLVPGQIILLTQAEIADAVTDFSAVSASRITTSPPQTHLRFRSAWLPAINMWQLLMRILTPDIRALESTGHLSS